MTKTICKRYTFPKNPLTGSRSVRESLIPSFDYRLFHILRIYPKAQNESMKLGFIFEMAKFPTLRQEVGVKIIRLQL